MTQATKIHEVIASYVQTNSTDLMAYAGPLTEEGSLDFIQTVLAWTRKRNGERERISLFLSTFGGFAEPAYRIARLLQNQYEKVRILIAGPCKSAGTLLTVGADEIRFGVLGEIGPIDVQIQKDDDIAGFRLSGLDTIQSIERLTSNSFVAFEHFLLNIVQRSMGAISTRTACDIACKLVAPLVEPIAAQIDPHRLAEVTRMIEVARAYGIRLEEGRKSLKPGALDYLVSNYPSHDFIIDYKEAEKLFLDVSEFSSEEYRISGLLGAAWLTPPPGHTIINLEELGRKVHDEEKSGSSSPRVSDSDNKRAKGRRRKSSKGGNSSQNTESKQSSSSEK